MQHGFEFRGLRCFPVPAEPATWAFLPLEPELQRGADGRPMSSLVDLGPSAYLLFTARWSAPQEDLDALRSEIARRGAEPDPGRIRLAFAPLESPRCSALMGDGGGNFQVVATSDTSRMPPYDATFNIFLQDARVAQARAALRGERGYLAIEYVASLRTPACARATLHARGDELAAWLRTHGADGARAAAILEEAVTQGVATIAIDAPEPHAGALAAELYGLVLERAAGLVPALMRNTAPGEVNVAVALEQEVDAPVRAFADVGARMAPAPSAGFITGGEHAAN